MRIDSLFLRIDEITEEENTKLAIPASKLIVLNLLLIKFMQSYILETQSKMAFMAFIDLRPAG